MYLVTILFCGSAQSAPSQEALPPTTPPEEENSAIDPDGNTNSSLKARGYDLITPNPKPSSQERIQIQAMKENEFYPFDSSMSPRIGAFATPTSLLSQPKYLLGISLMPGKSRESQPEISFDLNEGSTGLLFVASRWIFIRHSKFRPFTKAGGALKIEPSHGIAAPLVFKNYQLRVAGGFEYTVSSPMSLRSDLEMAYSLSDGLILAFVLGYSWGW